MTDAEYAHAYPVRDWIPLIALVAQVGERPGYVLAADGDLGRADLAYHGPSLEDWINLEAGIPESAPAPGLWVLTAEVFIDPGWDTPNGPPELSAKSKNVAWRRASAHEVFALSRGRDPFARGGR